MKSLIYGAVGALVSAVLLTSVATAMVCVIGAIGTVAYFQLETPQAKPFRVEVPTQSRTSRKGRDGRLVVQVGATPLMLYLDGEPMAYDAASMAYWIDATAGGHVIQVRNAWMKEVARHDVSLASGKKTLLKYGNRDKTFSRIGTSDLAGTTSSESRNVAAVAETPLVAVVATPAPAPEAPQARRGADRLGRFLTGIQISGDSSERRRSSESSTQYGELSTSGPAGSMRSGYVDSQSDEVETERRRGFRLRR